MRFDRQPSELAHPLRVLKSSPLDLREPLEHKPTRCLSPSEREDSKQKRQSPSEVNGVLTLARVYNGDEVAAWTDDQQAKHEATLQVSRNMDKFGVVEVVDRPQKWTSSLDTLRAQTTIGRYIQSANCGTRF